MRGPRAPRARTPRESNIYAPCTHRESPDLLRIELCSHVLGYSHAGRRPHRCGGVYPGLRPPAPAGRSRLWRSARPRRADGHRTPPLTPPSTGPARRGPRRVTPPTRHGPTRHCPRARLLSEARLCHAPINDDPHRLCESETSLGAHLGAHPTRFQSFSTNAPPRDPDAAQRRRRRGRGRWSRKVLRACARSPPRARRNLRSSFVA
jgi:hypothetical protein